MQYKESYWEGMYWDGLDARDVGAHKVSQLLELQPQLGVERHLLERLIQFVSMEIGSAPLDQDHYEAKIRESIEWLDLTSDNIWQGVLYCNAWCGLSWLYHRINSGINALYSATVLGFRRYRYSYFNVRHKRSM
jgi:hypothetical protein